MEQQPRLPIWFLIVNCGLVAAAFIAGTMLASGHQAQLPQPQGLALGLIHAEILESHVEPQDGQALLDEAISAMVSGLDRYSRYVPPAKVAAYEERTTGRYEGVGMVMQQHGEDLVVHFPFAGGPADRAGVTPGDKLIAVDAQSVYDLPLENRSRLTTELVRGPANSTVELRLLRGDTEIVAAVERADVQRPVVKWVHFLDREAGIGYLHLSDFHRDIALRIEEAIATLSEEAPLRGLVIDVRFNGGGSLEECVALCRTFQPEGTIVSTRRRGEEIERIDARADDCKHPLLPLVVLANADSASASEVFVGCLQDHDRATIVGTRTFGKGVVNTVYSWQDFKLKLTTGYFYTPNGRNLGGTQQQDAGNGEAHGIAPDIEVPFSKEERLAAFARLNAHEVPRRHHAAFIELAKQYDGIEFPDPPRGDDDAQLEKAIEALGQRIAESGGK